MGAPWYCTRESVMGALDIKLSARMAAQVDAAIESSSRSVEGFLLKRFYPEIATRYFDWPTGQYNRAWRLWLGARDLISVSALVAGGVTISASDYFLRTGDGTDSGPPYRRIEIDLDSSAAFAAAGTHQRAVSVTGVWADCPLETVPAGALAEALDASETGVDVTNSYAIGVGTVINVESERMIVTGKSMLTTAQTGSLTAVSSDETLAVANGALFTVGETLLLDSERVLIVDIAGNSLTVKRAVEGTTLAVHSTATIYAPRTLTVTRGALGTTAATHADTTAITAHVVPGLVAELARAESIVSLMQSSAAYARVVGSGDNEREASGKGLIDLRKRAWDSYGRKGRTVAV